MNLVIKFFTNLAMQVVNAMLRDKSNRDLGASQQREKNNEATIDTLKEWDEIDSKPESADDAFGVLGNFSKRHDSANAELSSPESSRSGDTEDLE